MARPIIDRRTFLAVFGAASAASLLAACTPGAPAAPTAAPAGAKPTTAPAAATGGDIAWYGVSTPLTGNNAEFGQTWQKAFAIALDEINGSGGVKGRKVDLVVEDTQADPKQSVPVAQKFVADPRILAELGDFASVASIAASPIYLRAKMVQFGFTNASPAFTKWL